MNHLKKVVEDRTIWIAGDQVKYSGCLSSLRTQLLLIFRLHSRLSRSSCIWTLSVKVVVKQSHLKKSQS